MSAFSRVIVIILDSVGIGALPDAHLYSDEGSDTLGNTSRAVDGLDLPNLGRLGLGCLDDVLGVPPLPTAQVNGAFGRLAMAGAGKDTIAGHWELAGVVLDRPIRTYPHGFPADLIAAFEREIGRKTIGNVAASGTEIIERLGREHTETGAPIVYTSADSVFQIAAHEDVIPVPELYHMCEVARRLCTGENTVGRIIARPFIGAPGRFKRTDRRRDYALEPPGPTMLDAIQEAGLPVVAIGKISDIYAGRGISRAVHTHDNANGVEQTLTAMGETDCGLIMTNLVDFDMVYGHRNNSAGYAGALEAFDKELPRFYDRLQDGDLLVITADHGCDPTTPSTDHSREYVPIMLTGAGVRKGAVLGTRSSLADCGATVLAALGIRNRGAGTSFLDEMLRDERA